MALSSRNAGQIVPASTDTKPRKRRREKVLEEDDYVEAMDRIITRDYFPDLAKLRNQHDYLMAKNAGDLGKMREIQLRYQLDTRNRTDARDSGAAPPTPHTPNFMATPLPSKRRRIAEIQREDGDSDEEPEQVDINKLVRGSKLDSFVQKFTSEDNASFQDLMDTSAEQYKQRYWWMQKDTKQRMLIADSNQRMAISWPHDPKNALMNMTVRNHVPLLESELPTELVANNTRFVAPKPVKRKKKAGSDSVVDMTADGASSRLGEKKEKNVDLDVVRGLTTTEEESSVPAVNGYEYVLEPSVTPYRSEAITTWGEIEGTPMLLEETETPINIAGKGKNSFKIAATPKRDQIGMDLERVARTRQRVKKAQSRPVPGTPRVPGGSMTPRTPAGQRMIDKLRHRRTGSSSLAGSYTPSHDRGGATPRTPRNFSTPVRFSSTYLGSRKK
eukprot:TRINITY_DN7280_c0_g1_i1.p1 TRINITY_DN7280_c0_g1~~TRINITY_DN7280_c0_g1_i1.p1  ORF type:complete len:451 (+),score=97.85 TRINITY_DN7280_c0_g1_i1:23-1354(+)